MWNKWKLVILVYLCRIFAQLRQRWHRDIIISIVVCFWQCQPNQTRNLITNDDDIAFWKYCYNNKSKLSSKWSIFINIQTDQTWTETRTRRVAILPKGWTQPSHHLIFQWMHSYAKLMLRQCQWNRDAWL